MQNSQDKKKRESMENYVPKIPTFSPQYAKSDSEYNATQNRLLSFKFSTTTSSLYLNC